MGMPVDHAGDASDPQSLCHRLLVDIQDRRRLALHSHPALPPHRFSLTDAFCQWQSQKLLLPLRAAEQLAHLLVVHIIATQGIAMQQQGRRTIQVDHHLFRQQGTARRCGKTFTQQEIAVAMLAIHPHPTVTDVAQTLHYRLESCRCCRTQCIIPHPVFKQVTKDVEGISPALHLPQKIQQQTHHRGMTRIQVQV